jgi:ribonuclease HI
MKLVAYIDGSCMGNPGESGFGVVLQDEHENVLASLGKYLGHGTNNTAEYHGLLGAIELAASFRADKLLVYSDSELLVKQMRGEYRIKKPHLKALYKQVFQVLGNSSIRLTVEHIPRSQNKTADRLARNAIKTKEVSRESF